MAVIWACGCFAFDCTIKTLSNEKPDVNELASPLKPARHRLLQSSSDMRRDAPSTPALRVNDSAEGPFGSCLRSRNREILGRRLQFCWNTFLSSCAVPAAVLFSFDQRQRCCNIALTFIDRHFGLSR